MTNTENRKRETLGSLCVLAAAILALVASGCRTAQPLSLWNDEAPAKKALIEYVASVTDSRSPDFVPAKDRIAVFDLDGTLFCETAPTYFDWLLFEHRVLDDSSFTPSEEQRTSATNARATGKWPGLSEAREIMVAAAYRGLTPEDFERYVHEQEEQGHHHRRTRQVHHRRNIDAFERYPQRGKFQHEQRRLEFLPER